MTDTTLIERARAFAHDYPCIHCGSPVLKINSRNQIICSRCLGENPSDEKGQLFCQLADALEAQQKRIDALEREKEKLIEDRARFPDRPDWVGDMIGAHYGNMENRIRSAESYTEQYRMRWSMEQRKRKELEAALENIVTWGNSDHCTKLRSIARAALHPSTTEEKT